MLSTADYGVGCWLLRCQDSFVRFEGKTSAAEEHLKCFAVSQRSDNNLGWCMSVSIQYSYVMLWDSIRDLSDSIRVYERICTSGSYIETGCLPWLSFILLPDLQMSYPSDTLKLGNRQAWVHDVMQSDCCSGSLSSELSLQCSVEWAIPQLRHNIDAIIAYVTRTYSDI